MSEGDLLSRYVIGVNRSMTLVIGTPISGALLTTDYIWWRPAVFSGVSTCQKLSRVDKRSHNT